MTRGKLTLTVGLPGSGKSTWAMQQAGTTRVNTDDIRKELGWTDWASWNFSGGAEAQAHALKMQRIVACLKLGHHVINDDTNLNRKRRIGMVEVARQYGAAFAIKDFRSVPLDVCIKQDALRKEGHRVGEKVIREMAARYQLDKNDPGPTFEPVGEQNPLLKHMVICDLDGTLCNMGDRSPFDASTCDQDTMVLPVYRVLRAMYQGLGVLPIYLSGREEKYREPTMRFFERYPLLLRGPLLMRPTGDFRKDWIVKGEIFDREIRGKYYIDFVLDDRNQVVDFWRSIGLTCFQVAKGDF